MTQLFIHLAQTPKKTSLFCCYYHGQSHPQLYPILNWPLKVKFFFFFFKMIFQCLCVYELEGYLKSLFLEASLNKPQTSPFFPWDKMYPKHLTAYLSTETWLLLRLQPVVQYPVEKKKRKVIFSFCCWTYEGFPLWSPIFFYFLLCPQRSCDILMESFLLTWHQVSCKQAYMILDVYKLGLWLEKIKQLG